MSVTDETKYLERQASHISADHDGVQVFYREDPDGRWMEVRYREAAVPDTWTEDGRPAPMPVPLPDPAFPAVSEALAACCQIHPEPIVISEAHEGARVWRIELPPEPSANSHKMRNAVKLGKLRVDMLVAAVNAELEEMAEDGISDAPAETSAVSKEAANLLNGGVLPDAYQWDPSTGDIAGPPGASGWFNCDPLLRVIAGAVALKLATGP